MRESLKAAIVSGATGGIGAAAVDRLLEAGFRTIALGRSETTLNAVFGDHEHTGGLLVPLRCDVCSDSDIAGLAKVVNKLAPSSLVLVNNAGVLGPIGDFKDCDIGEWCKAVDVNLSGAARLTHAVLDLIRALSNSAVINISTGASARPMNGWSAYCSSKAGLAMLTQMLHLENCSEFPTYGFQPGLVDTGMQARIRKNPTNDIGKLPKSDLLPADDPAKIITWLALEQPSDLAGKEFRADDPQLRRRVGLED